MIEHRFAAMGCEVIVGGGSTTDHEAIEERLFAEREVVFSRFVTQSELNRVNASAGRWTVVSPLFAETLRIALEAGDETEGSVRPTLGGALEAAGYTRDSSCSPRIRRRRPRLLADRWLGVRARARRGTGTGRRADLTC